MKRTILATIVALSIAGAATAQSLPKGETDLCEQIEMEAGTMLLSDIMAVKKLYPDSTYTEVSEWVGEAMLEPEMTTDLPAELQQSISDKATPFMDLIREGVDAGCDFE